MNVGLLRVFNHDTLRPGAIWPMHPHRDVEGITYVLAGEFEHADSLGNGGVLPPGGVQRMTLGPAPITGAQPLADGADAVHPDVDHADRRGLQPSNEQRQYTAEDRHNRLLRILRPEGADGDGVLVHQDASIYVARLDAGVSVEHAFTAGRAGYFYLIDGAADVHANALATGDAAKILDAGALRVHASAASELILIDVPTSNKPGS